MAKTICSCKNPPGGGVSCEENQFAICRVNNGVCQGECVDLPDRADVKFANGNQYARFLNELVYKITNEDRFRKSLNIIEALNILKSGIYRNPKTGEIIRFKFPKDVTFLGKEDIDYE